MKQIDRSRLRVAIELPDPDPVVHKDYVDRLNKVASALDQLGKEDPRLYGELDSNAVRYFQYLTTAAAKSGRLLLLHLDDMAAVTCILAGCGVFEFVPKKGLYEIALPSIEYSTVRRSALALLETMDDMGECHPEDILECVEPDMSNPRVIHLGELDGRFDTTVAERLKPTKARTFN
jgi:hypothetical protein